VGVALGTYNPNSTEAFFKQQKLPTFKARGTRFMLSEPARERMTCFSFFSIRARRLSVIARF